MWIGNPNLRPAALMETWEMDGWGYTLWTEKEIDELNLKNRWLYDYYVGVGKLHGACDVVRIEILERLGGVYIDADAKRLLNIDELLDNRFFAIRESDEMGERIANGVIGAVAAHPIITNYVTEMGRAARYEPPWSTIGGTLLTKMVKKYRCAGTTILEPHTFYPIDARGNKATTTGKVYAEHFWGSTHKRYGRI